MKNEASVQEVFRAVMRDQEDLIVFARDTFQRLDALFRREGILYWGLGGTALGALRHRGLIPWDDDIDIGITTEGLDRLYGLKLELEEETGLTLRMRFPRCHYVLYSLSALPLVIDVYVDAYAEEDWEALPGSGPRVFPKQSEMLPLREVPFYNFQIPVPRDAETYVRDQYGADCLEHCRLWDQKIAHYGTRRREAGRYVLTIDEVNELMQTAPY